jgi:DNA invertase Pin-like site-specific DNA recombinase
MTSTLTPQQARDRAARWLRVSTLKQDERNQEPDVDGWIAAHDYELAKCGPEGNGTYRLKASASKGKQQEMLDLVIEDMREDRLDVLVVWKSNRIERRGEWNAFDLARKVRDAGGRIEYVQDAYLNDTNSMSDVMLALAATKDRQYSADLRENALRNVRLIRANNGVFTDLPWGYNPEGLKLNKTAVPTDECREYWPQVLKRCADGDSCRTIGRWLDAEDVKTDNGKPWHEDVIRRLIKNPVYCGRRLGWKDAPLLPDEAVVSVDLWERANKALSNRPKRGPQAPTRNPVKPMLAKLKCARCGSAMYRIHAGSRDRDNFYYRCAGNGPQRKGCGNMVPLGRLERMVAVRVLAWNDEPYQIREWVEGESWDAEIADIKKVISELDPESKEDEAHREVLKAQLRDYRSRKITPGHWEYTDALNADGSVLTIGQHFFDLDAEGRREYLTTHDIRAEKTECCGGIRVVIDGREDVAHKEGCSMAEEGD